MAEMDKVRFVAGDEDENIPVKVWQGYDAASSTNAGSIVFVTAETLRQMAEYEWDAFKDSEWDRVHNAPTAAWDILAFGDEGARFAPDGVTPVYKMDWWTTNIVQRFNPNAGRTFDRFDAVGNKLGVGHFGAWENVYPVTGIPEHVGFAVTENDTPFARRDDKEPEPEKVYVESVQVVFSDGASFEMTQSPLEHDNGTTFSGRMPEGGNQLENRINSAIVDLNLYPEAEIKD